MVCAARRRAHEIQATEELYDCFLYPPELSAQKQEIEECHEHLARRWESRSVGWCSGSSTQKPVLRRTPPSTALSPEFELAWKLSMELNYSENERSVSCRTTWSVRGSFHMLRRKRMKKLIYSDNDCRMCRPVRRRCGHMATRSRKHPSQPQKPL